MVLVIMSVRRESDRMSYGSSDNVDRMSYGSSDNVCKAVFILIFFTYLPESQILTKILFIQANSFIIFTCLNPVLLVPGFGQVG